MFAINILDLCRVECKARESRNSCLFCSLMNPRVPELCLMWSKHSINALERVTFQHTVTRRHADVLIQNLTGPEQKGHSSNSENCKEWERCFQSCSNDICIHSAVFLGLPVPCAQLNNQRFSSQRTVRSSTLVPVNEVKSGWAVKKLSPEFCLGFR